MQGQVLTATGTGAGAGLCHTPKCLSVTWGPRPCTGAPPDGRVWVRPSQDALGGR